MRKIYVLLIINLKQYFINNLYLIYILDYNKKIIKEIYS